MWKKDDNKEGSDEMPNKEPDVSSRPRNTGAGAAAETATIGRSIRIKGEVTGDENLVIQGHVDGSVDLQKHSVTVGPDGEVKASIVGKVITVEGTVEGDLEAGEQIILRSSASVEGDLTAPRVVLEDGARFRGGVDMGEGKESGKGGDGSVAAKPRSSSEPSRPRSSSSSSSSVESSAAKGNSSGESAEVAS